MKKICRIGVCVLAVLPLFSWASVSASEALMKQLSQYKTFQARFRQSTVSAQNKLIAKSRGKCYIQRPNLFRWETTSPNRQVVFGNGQSLWVYDVDLMQATVRPVSKNKWSPAKLLMGDAKSLNEHFVVSEQQQKKQQLFILTQKQPQQTFRRVEFIFKKTHLQQLNVTNSLGQVARFVFSRARYNRPISAKVFQFKAQPGVDVIHVKE